MILCSCSCTWAIVLLLSSSGCDVDDLSVKTDMESVSSTLCVDEGGMGS